MSDFTQRDNKQTSVQQTKRPRGRPRKHPVPTSAPSQVNSLGGPWQTPRTPTMSNDMLDEYRNELQEMLVKHDQSLRDKVNAIARESAKYSNPGDSSKQGPQTTSQQISEFPAPTMIQSSQWFGFFEENPALSLNNISQQETEEDWGPLNTSLVQGGGLGFIEEIADPSHTQGVDSTTMDFPPDLVDIFNYRIDEMPYGTEVTAILPDGDQTFYDGLFCSDMVYEIRGGNVVEHPCQFSFGQHDTVLVSLVEGDTIYQAHMAC
ncbi:hypothetical protein TREMEDRAFT_58733 [Tremella mesenterica DSM 1558]|uniref:uncharacterized protein n=1 Tax=Tremella mesenterica (strain ATCC 24925 / CBS 8224 / DSM 1558 / NBRC 9311 / NRRL Y-6157 / RJB 2259-6 / UBC 559-6) TaxID=578456 RepID=UPI0003F490D7|nr:uncharacterized protein TREMEDRAFT_58733 [Tremella mesenterica DSM 1558]EIW72562.1 hypothetical protein TREMEDRAFT_58733 [Tremella mesenterica DSM 1558]